METRIRRELTPSGVEITWTTRAAATVRRTNESNLCPQCLRAFILCKCETFRDYRGALVTVDKGRRHDDA